VNGANLRLGNTVRAAEIEFDGRRFPFPVGLVLKNCVDFLLR